MREKTSVAIDGRVRRDAVREARRRGVSLSSLVNEALESLLASRLRPRRFTLSDLIALIDRHGPLPDEYVEGVRWAIQNQGEAPRSRWGS
jgi:hypothetical protein